MSNSQQALDKGHWTTSSLSENCEHNRKKKSFGEDSSAALDRYTIFASYKDDLVYVSSCTHSAQSSWENDKREEKKKMYLFKNEKVNFLTDESLESQPETLRWYVSEKIGAVSLIDGFLQSKEDCVYPPEIGSAWSWFGMHYNHNWFWVTPAEFQGVRIFRYIK